MKTSYLGQYTDETANEIAGELVRAGIDWNYKQAGALTKVFFAGEWGTRLYVEEERIEEARRIADRIQRKREAQ